VSHTVVIYINADLHEMFRMSPNRHLVPVVHLPK